MKISIIFPTYQRSKDLEIALDSLLVQTVLPQETIVVDQSDDQLTKTLCSQNTYKKIGIKYIYSDCKSPPKAKQIWMDAMSQTSDLFIFFDDDVKLMPTYLEEVQKFMDQHPEALGWGGKILNFPHKRNLIEKIWYIFFRTPRISNEFGSVDAQYKAPNKIQNVMSMIGCNMFYRKKIKDMGYTFVDRMKRYGHADDTFFAYPIYRDYPKSLFYVPSAEIYHYESASWRILKKQRFNQVIYHRYIFWKTYKFAMWKFYWWNIWFLAIQLFKNKNKRELCKNFVHTHHMIIKHHKKIEKNPEIINQFIYT